MTKKETYSASMPVTVETAFEHTTGEEYLREKAAYLGHEKFEILERSITDAGGTIKTRKQVKSEVPGFAAKILPSENTVTQTDTWTSKPDGSRVCAFAVEIKGVPATIKGALTLTGKGETTKGDVWVECKVSVPIIGGKVEGLVMEDLMKNIKGEQDFAIQYLEKHG